MAKRRGKKIIVLLITLGVIVAVVIVADRVAAGVAEGKVSDLIAEKAEEHEISSSKPPETTITGFPFLTQVAAGSYSEIDIELNDLKYGELDLPKMDITATDVTAKFSDVTSGSGPITAAQMSADGHIEYTALTDVMENATSAEVTSEGGGELTIKANADVAGTQIPVVGKATVEFTGDALSVSAHDFAADGVELPPGADGALNDMAASMSRTIDLPALPYDMSIDDVKFEPETMILTASASDVPLAL